jgi:small subunit ribosomal protein S18
LRLLSNMLSRVILSSAALRFEGGLGVALHRTMTAMTSSRCFSSGEQGGDDAGLPTVADKPTESEQQRPSPPTNESTTGGRPASLQHAKLWRQWVDGKLEDHQRQASAALGVPGVSSRPPQKPRKVPAKDWKAASRVQRFAQDRIASMLLEDGDTLPSGSPAGGYAALGTDTAAPSLNPHFTKKAEELSPRRLLPHKLFYPGQTYSPEELNPYVPRPATLGPYSQTPSSQRYIVPAAMAVARADFRNAGFLSHFLTDTGKMMPRRYTRLPAKVHREVTRQVKLARSLGILRPTAKQTPMLVQGGNATRKRSY